MNYRKVGRSGLHVSEISYGNWITHAGQVEEQTAIDCVRTALENGISTFDTADVYAQTKAEVVLAKALEGIRRESLEICTKVFHPVGPGPNDRGLSRKHIMESCNNSLRRLKTDYVDIYYAHRFDPAVPLEETMIAFADLVRQGKVLYLGISEWTADQIHDGAELARELQIPLVASQPQYSILWRVIEKKVIPACEVEGISQLVWSPLAQGILTGKYLPGKDLPEGSRGTLSDRSNFFDRFTRYKSRDEVLQAVQQLQPLAQDYGLTIGQLALAWVLNHRNVSSAIIGASRPDQIRENVKAVGVKLDAITLEHINTIFKDVAEFDPALVG